MTADDRHTGTERPNEVRCPTCGRVRMTTPPGTTALPTLGMARKASGAVGACDCGRAQPASADFADRADSAG